MISHKNKDLCKSVIGRNYISHFNSEDWGNEIMIMNKHGRSFVRVYWYDDDETMLYINMLSVDEDLRGNGLGTDLLNICEQIGKMLNMSESSLWVRKNSWVHDWYERNGYKDWMDYVGDKKYIWMKKKL